MHRYIIEPIDSLSAFASLEAEWRALEPKSPGLPFVTFDWNWTWWKHLHAERLGVTDRMFVRTLRDPQGSLCGVAPLMLTQRPGHGPSAVRQLQFFGADPNRTEIRTLAAPPGQAGEQLSALLDHLREIPRAWDFMKLTGVPQDAAASLGLTGFSSARWVLDTPNYFLTLSPTWEEFKSKLSRNIKESLRKCYNAPKRDGILFEVVVVREAAEVDAALHEFFRLHGARASADANIKHNDFFQDEPGREFLREICKRFAARDCLRIYQLRHQGKVLATRIGFVCGDALYLYYSGYDPSFGQYSIMTTTVAEAIQGAIREQLRIVNLSTGNDVSKLRWGPQETQYREALLVSPSRRGAIAHETHALASRGVAKLVSQVRLPSWLLRR